MKNRQLIAVAISVSVLASCSSEPLGCASDADCRDGRVCVEGTCKAASESNVSDMNSGDTSADTGADVAVGCDGRECGPDGLGGTCGACGPGSTCSTSGLCVSAFCGNGRLDPGEECDSAIAEGNGRCETSCPDDGNACTNEAFFGAPEDCDATCTRFAVINCVNDDGCCPAGCETNDSDC